MAVVARRVALVLRALGVGDLLTAVPALRATRRALPGHRLVLAAPPPLRPLVELTDAVDGLQPVPGLGPIPHPPPDVAVNLHGRGPASHRVLLALRPGRLVGFRRGELGVDGPRWDDREHEVVRWCRLVGDTLGGDPEPDDLELRPPSTAPAVPGAVVVHPGAAYPSRRWPVERFAAVAAELFRMGYPLVVTGSASERDVVDRVRQLAGLPAAASLAGRTSLGDLAALVAHARLVLAGDTGIGHLASAYRTPSVLLFGPSSPSLWGPPATGPHRVLWHGVGSGDPRASEPDPSLLAISPEEVLSTAVEMLCSPGADPDLDHRPGV